ncbi:MAG TPA: hypothetical protein VFO11_05470 [Candidatus Polarisedimenticolaceae bacterium]|nr:hypothetical protein [Candidatus Polarisedimenticolaceae bacterium]
MTAPDSRFADRAIRRRPLFLALSWIGIAVALLLAGYYAYRRYEDPTFPIGVRVALVTLILLNARQNLRQYKFATLLMGTGTYKIEKPGPPA